MLRKLILFIGLIVLLAACSEKPKPETTFERYMKAWEQQDFQKMYSLLTDESQKNITEKDFVERYAKIYSDIEAENLKVTYQLPEEEQDYEEEDTPQFDFHVKMDTMAGPLEINHKASLAFEEQEDSERWSMKWNPEMIFPGMKEGYAIKPVVLKPVRGEIFDTNGEKLAENGKVQEVGLVPAWMKEDREEVKKKLSELLDISVEEINAQLDQSWVKEDSYVPLAIIPADDEVRIDAIRPMNGTRFVAKDSRVYPLKESFAHLIGYVGEITAEELEKYKGKRYTPHDYVGKKGLELILEDDLRGELGGEILIVDSDKTNQAILATKEPVNGKDFTLTIDASVQSLLYNQMYKEAGAAAALNPMTGEVLALVSTPAFNPNDLVHTNSTKKYQDNPLIPLRNRFTKTYAPGSTFKPITAAIGLKTDAIDPAEEKAIPANNQWKKDSWGNYYVTRVKSPETQINLQDALVYSDNIYFAMAMLDIGADAFLQESKGFGFDEKIPFPYYIEPSSLTNEDNFQNEVQLVDTSYGQGQVEMSALHLGLSYTPFITKGKLMKPILFADEVKSQTWKENIISEETANTITQALIQVIEHPNGSGKEAKINGLQLAGKTGTAELKASKEEKGKENGWFVAWNTENPSLLVSMMIEDVQNGSKDVTPKVKAVFEGLYANQ